MNSYCLTRRESLFEAIADIAMTNHYRAKHGRYVNFNETFDETKERLRKEISDGVGNPFRVLTFRCPTSHPRGYFSSLLMIADAAPTRAEFNKLFYGDGHKGKSVSFTLDKLRWAGLVHLDYRTHRYSVTDLGRAYIAAVNSEFNVAD